MDIANPEIRYLTRRIKAFRRVIAKRQGDANSIGIVITLSSLIRCIPTNVNNWKPCQSKATPKMKQISPVENVYNHVLLFS